MTTFGKEIRSIRSALGMNQAEFAEAAGVSQGSVSKWERDLEQPRTAAWLRIRALYEAHDADKFAGAYDPLRRLVRTDLPYPSVTAALLVGSLDRPLASDVYAKNFEHFGTMSLPYLEEHGDSLLAWMVPAINVHSFQLKPGSIVYTTWSAEDYDPSVGERVVIQSQLLEGRFLYSLVYYGRSARDVEWFTPMALGEKDVRLSDTHPVEKRAKEGIRVVGKVIATLTWESPNLDFLARMTDDRIFGS